MARKKKIDEDRYFETRQSLMSAANGDDVLIEIVEEQLEDMKSSGYFDLETN